MTEIVQTTELGASGQIFTGKGFLAALLIGMDEANDATVSVHDGTDNTGPELIPTNKYDASALGLNGVVFHYMIECWDGAYVEITSQGTVEVVGHYTKDARKGGKG